MHYTYCFNAFILCSILAAAYDGPQDTLKPATNFPNISSSAPLLPARPTETVTVTITKALRSTHIATISIPTTNSSFAIPASVTDWVHAGEHEGAAGPAHTCTTSHPWTIGHGSVWPSSDAHPMSTNSNTTALIENTVNSTDLPKFTLNPSPASTTPIPFAGHYTLHRSLPAYIVSPNAPTTPGSSWPITATGYATTTPSSPTSPIMHDDAKDKEDNDDDTAWAGTDNAIISQMQGRSLPHLSPPPIHLTSAAVPRVQKFWRDSIRRAPAKGDKVYSSVGQREEANNDVKRLCTPCDEEEKIACRGDVAIGVCKGGCVEMRFLGRGQGNGCEDD